MTGSASCISYNSSQSIAGLQSRHFTRQRPKMRQNFRGMAATAKTKARPRQRRQETKAKQSGSKARLRHRRQLHGVDRPHGQKVVGAMPPSRPTEILDILLCRVLRSQKYSQNYKCVIMKLKKCADFSLKMHQKRLAAVLRPDPLGELTALPRPLAGFKG